MRRLRLPVVLWGVFLASIVLSGIVLLRACGLLPLPSAPLVLGWNFCPATPFALSVEAARGANLRQAAADLELALGRKQLACASIPKPPPPPLELPTRTERPSPQQTALLKPPPPPLPKLPAALPADRWANKDLGLLDGCWILGSETGWSIGRQNCNAQAGSASGATVRADRRRRSGAPALAPISA